MKATPREILCPRCDGSGEAPWRKPDGSIEDVRCGLCKGTGKVPPTLASGERRTRRTLLQGAGVKS